MPFQTKWSQLLGPNDVFCLIVEDSFFHVYIDFNNMLSIMHSSNIYFCQRRVSYQEDFQEPLLTAEASFANYYSA
jgi:hypothetical protein